MSTNKKMDKDEIKAEILKVEKILSQIDLEGTTPLLTQQVNDAFNILHRLFRDITIAGITEKIEAIFNEK